MRKLKLDLLGDAGVVDESFGVNPQTGDHMAILGMPEPSTLILLAIGTLAITVGWWRQRGRVA